MTCFVGNGIVRHRGMRVRHKRCRAVIPYFVTRVQKLASEERVSSRILWDVVA